MLEKAIQIAARAHEGQKDKAGQPYILHPLRVMLRPSNDTERICGVLHDVIEDTDITLEMLQSEGFTSDVLTALDALTKRQGESYDDFISRVLKNEIACNVKLADLSDNMDLSRLQNPPEDDFLRVKKYQKAVKRIRDHLKFDDKQRSTVINTKISLTDNLQGRSITVKVIPTVCNLENMLKKLVSVNGDFEQLKQWEKRSYTAYLIDEVKSELLSSLNNEWKNTIRRHILSKRPSDFGASVIDIYLVAYVAETFGPGKDEFFKYVKCSGISDNGNSAQAIWQVGKGDGVFLDILNDDGSVKDWDFISKWAGIKIWTF